MLRNLLVHVSRYSLAGLAGTIAGLISFPILTRMLSVSDYGLLSLIITTIYFIAAFGKAGLQFSIVRYYADSESGESQWNLSNYYSTIVIGMLGIGFVIMVVWALIVYVLPGSIWGEPKLKHLFLLTAILVFAEVSLSMLTGFLQARQQSGWLSIFRVIERYTILLVIVFTLYFISRSLEGVFIARIIAQLTVISILAYFVIRKVQISRHGFSPGMIKEMLIYGVPLLGNELVYIILSLGDRYIIQWQIGSEPLGAYAAGYNLCEYVKMMLVVALFQAIRPMYFKLWAEEGKAATQNFIERSLYFYLMLCFPIIAGVAVVGPVLLDLITAGKYSEGASVIPYIIAGLMVYGMHSMLGAGIFIKKSSALIWITLAAAVLNIILNIILIPRFGIEGAAQATLISYIFMTVIEALYGRRLLAIAFPFLAALKFLLLSLVMYFALKQIVIGSPLMTMFAQMIGGGILYAMLLLLTDNKARNIVLERFKK